MIKVLVTGANGQLGSELQELSRMHTDLQWTFTDREQLDICSRDKVEALFTEHGFNWCINAAAYTAVDKAESEQEAAFAVNESGAANLAKACSAHGAKIIHVSTDFVFDGSANKPITEAAEVAPLGVYGESKWKGEEAVRNECERHYIVRTSWVYSSHGNNFLKTMLRLGAERENLNVVFDQVGTPTYAAELAKALIVMLRSGNEAWGTYHYSNEGVCSWYDFAAEIMEMAGLNCKVAPINSEQYPTPAKRPPYSVLHKGKIKEAFDLSIPYWRESLANCLRKMNRYVR